VATALSPWSFKGGDLSILRECSRPCILSIAWTVSSLVQSLQMAACSLYRSLVRTCSLWQLWKL